MNSATSVTGAGKQQKGVVPAVARAARLLDILADAREPLSLAALTDLLGLPKSTTHTLCSTLVKTGLVTRFDNGAYHLGPHVMDLAHAFLSRTDLTAAFVKVWDSMAVLPEETIILSVLDGTDVVYLACRNGSRPLGVTFRIGMRLPANCTATGKALLSTLSPARLSELFRTQGFRTLTRNSISNLDSLHADLEKVRRDGYSVDNEETREGMVCFGAPVFDSRGAEAVAGVAVSMLKADSNTSRATVATEAVMRLAAGLSKRLGARVDPSARNTA
jgi:DNA-binding IclR family transcriptional regulator